MSKPFVSLSIRQRISIVKKELPQLKAKVFYNITDEQVEFCKTHYKVNISGLMYTDNGYFVCLNITNFLEKVDKSLIKKDLFIMSRDLFFLGFAPKKLSQLDKAISYLVRNTNIKYIEQA